MVVSRAHLDGLSVPPDSTLLEVMGAIDRGSAEIALVVDGAGCLVGTVTDGDVRRALLAGASVTSSVSPHVSTDPVTVSPDVDRAHVLDLMQAHQIGQVPVVDEDGSVVGLHLLRSVLGADRRPNWAVIAAGGRGSRLRPMTESIPKPMVPVAGRPLLERIILHLVGNGVREIVLAVNYRADVIEDHFGDGADMGCRIRYLRETPELPLGTAGCLAAVRELDGGPTDPVLVMNGDLIVDFAVGDLLDAHHESGAVITVAAAKHTHQVPFGVLDIAGGVVTAVVEKPTVAWSVNAGVYVLDPSVLARVPEGTRTEMPTVIEDAIGRGELVSAWQLQKDWIDVGRPEDLQRARGGPEPGWHMTW